METVSFTSMSQGTREDYAFLEQFRGEDRAQVADNLLSFLKRLDGPTNGLKINRYHDMLAPDNHSQVAAAILRPFISEKNYWIVAHHGLFQGYYYYHHIGKDRDGRERLRGHPHYQACVDFCERWDQSSFDPDYDTLTFEFFEPMVRRLFAGEPRGFD
jgi:hypothetical protein